MKKTKLFLLMLLAVTGWGKVAAETVSPYEVDFNENITTTDPDFAIASNWGHVVSTYYRWGDDNYVNYSFMSESGVEGSGAMRIYTNQKTYGTYDLLVTPLVYGTVTLYVKPIANYENDSAFLEFYSMNESGTTRGEMLATTNFAEKSNSEEWDWYALTITLDTPQRIGIRGGLVYIDNFSAEYAEIIAQSTMKVTGVMNSNEQTGTTGTNPVFNQGADGNTVVALKARIENTGDVDFVAGTTENYTLTLAQGNSSSATTYFEDATFDIPVDLAVGESKIIDVEFTVPATTGWTYFYIRENVSGNTSSSYRYCQILEYASKFIFDVAGTSYYSSSSATNKPISFGKVAESTTLNYEIYNSGTAPLVINSFTLPEGFSSDAPTGEFTVQGGEKKQIAITMDATAPGIFSGNLTIEYTNYGKAMATYTLGISGTVLDPSKNLISFDNGTNGQFPAGSIHSDQVYISSATDGGATNWYLQSTSTTTKFITPLLTAEAGESFTYDTWYSSYSYSCAIVVYISKDRVNWTQVDRQTYSSGIGSTPATFTVTIPEAGDYYLAFELISNALLDNIYGLTLAETPAHDWYIMSSDVPNKGKQNADYTASVQVQNIAADADQVETATLYVNGEAVATVEGTELAGNDKTAAVGTGRNGYSNIETPATITFTYKPHNFGTFPAYIELKSGETVMKTEEVSLTIAEETLEAEKTLTANGTSGSTPLNLNYNNSESVSLYTAFILKDQLGLVDGDKIGSIVFKAYKTADVHTTLLSVYYQWTDDTEQASPSTNGLYDVSGMIPYMENELHQWDKIGSSSELEDYLVLDFTEPLVYQEGKSLRIVIRSLNQLSSSNYKNVYWEKSNVIYNPDGDGYLNYRHYTDTPGNRDEATGYTTDFTASWSWEGLPNIHVNLVVEPKTLTGIVTEEDGTTPVTGATVTIRNNENDIEYFATTDETGAYTVNVVQDRLTYTTTVTANGYETLEDTEELNFTEQSHTKNFVLTKMPSVDIAISQYGYSTFYYSNSAYIIPEGVTAYIVSGVEGKSISLVPLDGVIPAGCGVLLEGAEGSYTFEATSEEVPGVDNMLRGTDETETIVADPEQECKYYMLSVKNDVAGFYFGVDGGGVFENKAHKAYLAVPVKLSNGVNFYGFDNATGINYVRTSSRKADGAIYNLSGQRVNNSYKGVVIVNGKKVLKK